MPLIAKIKFQRQLKRLQRAQQEVAAQYEREIDVARHAHDPKKVQSIRDEAHFEDKSYADEIARHQTRYLIRLSEHYLIPPPNPDDWARDDDRQSYGYLTAESRAGLRKAVRAEEKFISAWWTTRLTAATGVIGALIGLFSLILHKRP